MDKDKIVVKENNNVPAKNGVLLADMDVLYKNSIELIQYARRIAVRQINLVQLMTFYSLGRWIVEVEQQGESRAKYGKQVSHYAIIDDMDNTLVNHTARNIPVGHDGSANSLIVLITEYSSSRHDIISHITNATND